MSPMRQNVCDLWIWAIQIKRTWLDTSNNLIHCRDRVEGQRLLFLSFSKYQLTRKIQLWWRHRSDPHEAEGQTEGQPEEEEERIVEEMDVSRESVKGQGFYYVTADEAKTQSINQMSGPSQCSTNSTRHGPVVLTMQLKHEWRNQQ